MFSDKLINAITRKKSCLCLGLDPDTSRIPKELITKHEKRVKNKTVATCNAIYEFNKNLIDACDEFIVCVKPQIAFYEVLGYRGFQVFEKTVTYARKRNLLVIADAKRNDISSTAKAYAKAFFDSPINSDAITVNPYLGSDGIHPFTDYKDKGVFVLLKTSNPSSIEIQMLSIDGKPLYFKIADLIKSWGQMSIGKSGFSSVGAVVGATFPDEARYVREKLPNTIFLVPGIGTQGGKYSDLPNFFNKDKVGAIINSSRNIIFAYEKSLVDYKLAASKKAKEIRDEINKALGL